MHPPSPPLPPSTWFLVARATAARGDLPGAVIALRKAMAERPADAASQALYANITTVAGRVDLALTHFARAVALDPLDAVSWLVCAEHLFGQFAWAQAGRFLRRAAAAQPGAARILRRLGAMLRDLGEPVPALAWYDRALAVSRDEATERDSLLTLLYVPDVPPAARLARHRAYAARHAPDRPRPPARSHTGRGEGRRLHVGYLSSGFFAHPTGAVTARLIEAHDRNRFEISLFAHVAAEDPTSARMARAADRWINVQGEAPDVIASRMREAGIDILVGLCGRYDPVVWPVAALRPAPVQIAFHDTATSGMAAFDHLVSDAVLSPRHGGEGATERLLRLPSFPLHELPPDAPAVSALPAARSGRITFGSLNSASKLNDGVVALWARVLSAVPGSRLLIKAPALSSPRMAARLRAAFAGAGIVSDRIELLAGYVEGQAALLSLYDRIDIGLDTFPYAGGMTTFEALCQGVPVVTLADRDMVGRWGATLAIHAGHPGLVADTPESFVAIARGLACDLSALARLRARLRGDFLASPLCDAGLKARHLERAYLRMCA